MARLYDTISGPRNQVGHHTRPDSALTNMLANFVYIFFGLLEALLAFRLVLKLLGANTGNAFVSFVYNATYPFIVPFEGIFSRAYSEGVETTSVLEPSTIVAIIVYALLAWAIVGLIRLFGNRGDHTHETL